MTRVDEQLAREWRAQRTEAEKRRREQILWVWTVVGAGVFLAVFLWAVVLSFTQTGP